MPMFAQTESGNDATGIILGVIGAVVLLFLYLIPTIVAIIRRDKLNGIAPIVVVNILLGWSFLGWVVALVMAVRTPPPPVVIIQQSPTTGGPTTRIDKDEYPTP